MTKKIGAWIGIVIGFCSLVGLLYAYDQRVAKADDVKSLGVRLEQKIQSDLVSNLQQRIWQYEDRYGTDCTVMPANVRDEYRNLLKDKIEAQTVLDDLRRGKR